MRPSLFWVIAAALVAVAVHAAYLLAAPGFALTRSIGTAADSTDRLKFHVLAAEDQKRLFPTFPLTSVFGLCSFDVSNDSAKVEANVPDRFWTFTVYSRDGSVIYSVNNRQSGTNTFTLSLKKAPGLIESLLSSEPEGQPEFDGWNVATPEPKGFAVFWIPLREAAERKAVEEALLKTACKKA